MKMTEQKCYYQFKRVLLALNAVFLIGLLSACSSGDDGFFFSGGDLECKGSVAFADCSVVPDDDDGSAGGGTFVVPSSCSGADTGVIDGCGDARVAMDIFDPVSVNFTGLGGSTRYSIVVTDPLSAEITPAGGLEAMSDESGNLYRATLVQNALGAPELGEYTVSVTEVGGTVAAQTDTYTVEDRSRVRCVDGSDVDKASFLSSQNVFAKVEVGAGELADGGYDVYVLSDLQLALADGDAIGGTASSVIVTGGTGSIDLGIFGSGSYDVLVDVNGNAVFDLDTDLISRHARLHACFVIQTANSGAAITDQIGSDRRGNKRDIFDPDTTVADIRDVFVSVAPGESSTVSDPISVNTYAVTHRDAWLGGEALTDFTAALAISPVQLQTNSLAPWLVWNRQALVAGCYDVIIDTNKNGVFDLGIDIVDNQDHLGDNTQCGVRVSTSNCSTVDIRSHSNLQVVTETAITLAGSITGTLDSAFITITSGEQSNTIAVTLTDGGYSSVIPLFNGDNHITVSGVFADESSCSETITVTAQTELALFRAQLTWDGDTDMDLHVVRPTGVYSNGGSGADDCNYGNCNVGTAGTGSNNIEWGVVGEDDDPKLDVDCISCGNGIENIWMNQISENGSYTVYVDAFSGTETNVTVTIFIRGAAVGQVNCGTMDSGSATDSCRVGTINWSGGSSGAGSFAPDGTKASDF
jgi:hypothetical protein